MKAKFGCCLQALRKMPRRKGSEVEEDEDYDPYDSHEETRRVRQKGESGGGSYIVRSSRGRVVKVTFLPKLQICL